HHFIDEPSFPELIVREGGVQLLGQLKDEVSRTDNAAVLGHANRTAPGLLVVEDEVAWFDKLVRVKRLAWLVDETAALAIWDHPTIQVNRHETRIWEARSGDLASYSPELGDIPM